MKNRSWYKLTEQKCPVVGCVSKGIKTQLIEDGSNLLCPKCKGAWSLNVMAPMDICWTEIRKPTSN